MPAVGLKSLCFVPHAVVTHALHPLAPVGGFAAHVVRQMSAYCASKFAFTGFSDSLRREMKEFGVKVSIIQVLCVWGGSDDCCCCLLVLQRPLVTGKLLPLTCSRYCHFPLPPPPSPPPPPPLPPSLVSLTPPFC